MNSAAQRISTLVSGVVVVTIGLGIRLLGGGDVNTGVLALLLGGAALTWAAALFVYAGVREPLAEAPEEEPGENWLRHSWQVLKADAPFRRLMVMRTLLLTSAPS